MAVSSSGRKMLQKKTVNQPNCTVGMQTGAALWEYNRRHLVQKEHPDDEGGGHDGSRVVLLPDLHVDVVQRHVVLGPKHWHAGNNILIHFQNKVKRSKNITRLSSYIKIFLIDHPV